MKKRKTEPYLIISSAQLGMDDDILSLFANVSKYYKTKVYHLGPLATESEIKLFNKYTKEYQKARETLMLLETSGNATEARVEKADERVETARSNLNLSTNSQKNRIKHLRKYFSNIEFITTESISILDKNEKFILNGLDLTNKVMLAPIPPTGMGISGKPIQARAINYLKRLNKSWIVAHPVPSVECFPRPGINQAYNFFTVGSLRHSPLPLNTRQQSEFSQMPAAVLVLVDTENGEFHPRPLHVDYKDNIIPNPYSKDNNYKPMILDDGLVFIGNKVIETKSIDRATVSTDDHAPYEHPGVLGALRTLNTLYQPHTFINSGDGADFVSVCHHIKHSLAKREGLRLTHDIESLRKLLEAQANTPSIKKRVLIDSNHHDWVTQYADENPAMIGIIDWRTLASEVFFDWDVFITNDRERENDNIFFFGDYAIRHGHQEAGLQKAERMFERGKYFCGHWHRYESWRRAIMQGCGAKLSPTYLNGKQTAWQNQVSTFTKYNGVAACNPKIVLHDKKQPISRFSYRGDIYEAPHYVISHPNKKIYDKIAKET